MNKDGYLARLQAAIQQLHGCGAVWREAAPVHLAFRGKTVWQRDVEIFDVTGHPKAKRCYAWSHREGPDDQGKRFVAVLEIPPVDPAKNAVQVQVVKDVKHRR